MVVLVSLTIAGCTTGVPETSVPETTTATTPGTSIPEASTTATHGTSTPETTTPETTTPETTTPETTTPETTTPETTTPGATAPEGDTSDDTGRAPEPGSEPIEFAFSFETDTEGWVVDFADLPTDYDQSIYELDSGHRALPEGLDGSGIYIQGHNRSDDLFMYLKRQVDGLTPSASYTVTVTVAVATNVAANMVGIGGSPGESVYVKAGASTVEPQAETDRNGHLRMTIDKGNQSRGGPQMVVLGDVAHPGVTAKEFRIKNLDNLDSPVIVEADSTGSAWLIVGTDSGFEGLTRLYYDRISFKLAPS